MFSSINQSLVHNFHSSIPQSMVAMVSLQECSCQLTFLANWSYIDFNLMLIDKLRQQMDLFLVKSFKHPSVVLADNFIVRTQDSLSVLHHDVQHLKKEVITRIVLEYFNTSISFNCKFVFHF